MSATFLSPGGLSEVQNRFTFLDQPTPRVPAPGPRLTAYHCTLEEVAIELGVTREAVRQMEKKALAKCRRWCRARDLDLETLLREAAR